MGTMIALGSEESYRLLVESMKDYAIFMLDPEGRIASWNQGAERFKGYRTDEIIGKHYSIFYPREALERGLPEMELETARKEGRYEDEGWRLRKDGKRFWANVVISALRDKNGSLLGFCKVTRDMSDKREAERRFRDLFESAPDAMIIVNGAGSIVLVNYQTEKIFGYSRVELLGQKIEMLIPERFRGGHSGHRTRYSAHPHARPMGMGMELYGLRKDGSEVPVEISLSPLETEEETGEALVITTVRDISERKRNEEALRDHARLLDLPQGRKGIQPGMANRAHSQCRRKDHALCGHPARHHRAQTARSPVVPIPENGNGRQTGRAASRTSSTAS